MVRSVHPGNLEDPQGRAILDHVVERTARDDLCYPKFVVVQVLECDLILAGREGRRIGSDKDLIADPVLHLFGGLSGLVLDFCHHLLVVREAVAEVFGLETESLSVPCVLIPVESTSVSRSACRGLFTRTHSSDRLASNTRNGARPSRVRLIAVRKFSELGSLAPIRLGQAEVARVVDLSAVLGTSSSFLLLTSSSCSSSSCTCILGVAVVTVRLRGAVCSGSVKLSSREWL